MTRYAFVIEVDSDDDNTLQIVHALREAVSGCTGDAVDRTVKVAAGHRGKI